MRSDSSVSAPQRSAVIGWCVAGYGPRRIARHLGVRSDAVKTLSERWWLRGEAARVRRQPKTSTFAIKAAVVQRALAGETKAALAEEFDLASPQRVAEWVRVYRAKGEDG